MTNKLLSLSNPKAVFLAKTLTVSLITAGTLSFSGYASAKTISPSTAKYSFTIENKYKGTATRTLSKSGNNWSYKVNARVSGVATGSQYSKFRVSGNKVVPSYASTTYKIFGIGRTHKLQYSGSKVVSTYKGRARTLSMPRQAYDELSLEVQIRQELLNGKFSGSYYLVKKDKVERVRFRKSGNTRVSVPAGTYNTVKVSRVHGDSGRRTTFWLAPSLDYLPVKVIQSNDGKKVELKLSSVK